MINEKPAGKLVRPGFRAAMKEFRKSARAHGIWPTIAARLHPKTTSRSLWDVAEAVSVHGVRPTLGVFGHPEVNRRNIWFASAAASSVGTKAAIELLREEKAARKKVLEEQSPIWLMPAKAMPGEVANTLAIIGREYGHDNAMAAWRHPRTHVSDIGRLASLIRDYGKERVFAVWDHPEAGVENVRDVLQLGHTLKRLGLADYRNLMDRLKLSEKAGHSVGSNMAALRDGAADRIVSEENLYSYAALLERLPRNWKLSDLIENGRDAKYQGIPPIFLPGLQKELMERHHFPNAGLIQELYKAKMRDMGKKA